MTSNFPTLFNLVTMATILSLAPVAYGQAAPMPAEQQNALVQKYCAVCHTDAFPNGQLSLEHFDATRPEPGVAAMVASKLRNKALGASGQALPDRATQDALLTAISAEAAGADHWVANRSDDHLAPSSLTASIVQAVPSRRGEGDPDLYRLILACNETTHEARMQLAWSPDVGQNGRVISVAADGKAVATYTVEGNETMGNGQPGTSGPGAVLLYDTGQRSGALPAAMPLPQETLTVSDLFPGQTVVFPFSGLSQEMRRTLSACFNRSIARR